jgi:hypothetical protein
MSEPFELIYPASGLHIWIVPTIANSDGLDRVTVWRLLKLPLCQ